MENAAHVPHLIYLFLLELYKMVLNIIKNKNNKKKKKEERPGELPSQAMGWSNHFQPTPYGQGIIRPILHGFFSLYFFNNF
jgi:hypothetical protein